MADIAIWDGTTNFVAGESTPFGFYDDDLAFQEDAPKVARYIAEKLGFPVLDVELSERNFYTAFEEAVTAYGKEVIEAIAAETISSQIGGSASGTAVNKTLFKPSLKSVIETSKQYGMEAGVGGEVDLRSALIDLNKMNINLGDKNKKINLSEKKILIEMLANPGKAYSREEIGKISGINQERSIDVMITRLRQKIEANPKNPKYLQTIRGSGYVLWIE